MATSRRRYIAATFIVSCVALVLLIVALATNSWITSLVNADAVNGTESSEVKYGLFKGTYIKALPALNKFIYDISIVCDFGENACVWSCKSDKERRKEDLASLLTTGNTSNSNCHTQELKTGVFRVNRNPHDTSPKIRRTTITSETPKGDRFINAGLWICTLLSLILAMLLAAITALLSVVNMASNPVHVFLATEGLYYWNGAAASLDLLTLIFWGTQYGITLKNNVALYEVTAVNSSLTSEGLASLGWSYWLVLVASLCSIANIGVLAFRDYKLRREPPPPTYNPDKAVADGTLFLY